MGVWATNSKGQRYKIAGVGLPGPAATINGMNTLTVTAGDHIKLDQADGELKIGVNLDNGSIAGDTSLLDDLKSPGTYNWLDEEGELGIAGGLWNVAVTNSAYSTGHPSITQALVGTYGPGVTGRVLARSFYYANNPQWTPWRELVSLDQISNPNLLDNWYFADPVNQRGQAEYGEGYTIDRWCLYVSGNTTISIENGVVIHEGAGGYFQQRLERSKMEKLLGQAATLSVLIDNQLYSATDLLGYPGNRCIIRGLPVGESSLFWDDVKCEVNFSLTGGAGVLQAVKLELGSQQTLAHRDASGNWVLNDPPPNKALELAKCQRYQFVIGNRLLAPFGTFVSRASGCAFAFIPLPAMRAAPTVTFYGNFRAIASNRETAGSNLTGVISGWSASGVEIAIHSFEGLSVGDAGWLDTRDANAMVIFDANI